MLFWIEDDFGAGHQRDDPSRRRGRLSRLARLLQADRNESGEPAEVGIRRENGQPGGARRRRQEEVGIRPLQAHGTACVEVARGALEVALVQWFVGEGAQVIAKAFEYGGIADPAQELLRIGPIIATRPSSIRRRSSATCAPAGRSPPPQRQRPDRRVDEDFHRRRRCFL